MTTVTYTIVPILRCGLSVWALHWASGAVSHQILIHYKNLIKYKLLILQQIFFLKSEINMFGNWPHSLVGYCVYYDRAERERFPVEEEVNQIKSIPLWFQALILLWFYSLTWPYSVSIKDVIVIFFTEYFTLRWFYVENSKPHKNGLAGFSQTGSPQTGSHFTLSSIRI